MQFHEITEERIKSAEINSADQGYWYLVKNLMVIGVDHYVVNVESNTVTYFGQFGEELTLTHPLPERVAAETFNLDEVKDAIRLSEEGTIDYPHFLDKIAQAGIHTYVADFNQMTVIYQGPNSEYEFVQTIQEI